MLVTISNSQEFFLWDYKSTLFPLHINSLMVDRYSKQILDFIQTEVLGTDRGFQNQHRVFATKRGWFLRATVKLDPVAEYFLYDFIYRNRHLFRKSPLDNRSVHGYRIVGGEPISILKSYSSFKKAIAQCRARYNNYVYFDVSAYFSHIYHHDLIRWCEDAGANEDDVNLFGKFLREIVGGRSTNCLPQGIYPSKMVGSAFLGFLEASSRMRSAQSVRLMDDMWLFDDDREVLIADFLNAQSLLTDRGLAVNEDKSSILEGHDPEQDLPPELDDMKKQLLQRRRDALLDIDDYGDVDDEEAEGSNLEELSQEEQEYLMSLLNNSNIQEEDAELVLTLMSDHSSDVMRFIPMLIADFPGLAKRLYYFCIGATDKTEVTAALYKHISSQKKIPEYQLFWFGMMAEDYLLKTPNIGELLMALYDHENATDITKAKILEIPEKRFCLPDLREEQLRTGHSDWAAWSAAVGSRIHPKGQRNQMLKYFRRSSPMNRLIGEFVETSFK